MSSQNNNANALRHRFLSFFNELDHRVLPSSPIVPFDDPSLLFINAGMNQFKRVFMGEQTLPFKRATTAQKCLRAGGKHNDLENVGLTFRHHTFFEMLGNFSFGDYFKEEAIFFAWNFITKELEINPQRLTITTHSSDEESANLWKKIANLPDSRLLSIDSQDNFWSMGSKGPCGPCTEIFYDYGDKFAGGPPGSPDEDGDRFIEIWNVVFMEFDQQEDGSLKPLMRKGVDTGMGLERLTALMCGTPDNYQSDLFTPLIEESAQKAKVAPNGPMNTSLRVIADHLRAMTFLLAENVIPSNEGTWIRSKTYHATCHASCSSLGH